ncbi:ACP phosphodiesterase [Pinibacter soli]|uniref:ACP phosphodiesterase n=1 Tax=Pinibacter soli TaxID=3044211 RepID=A0ABT6R7N2_9BACT|nr:ACP phosphodiesterase [Pinibacter soli]MDI3318577.1 ACP phosphodiesterase [Pinibacter soli]
MNFLAHAYLSFNEPDILVGNMISDFVKGRKKFDYPEGIQKGIQIHRNIDEFTDTHQATKRAMQVYKPAYRLYSTAFVDVTFDYFLANDKSIFSDASLFDFSRSVYATLEQYFDQLPGPFRMMFPYMKSNNWLYNYRTKYGIERSFGGVVRRSQYLEESDTAFQIFNDNIPYLQECYNVFFPQLVSYAKTFAHR